MKTNSLKISSERLKSISKILSKIKSKTETFLINKQFKLSPKVHNPGKEISCKILIKELWNSKTRLFFSHNNFKGLIKYSNLNIKKLKSCINKSNVLLTL